MRLIYGGTALPSLPIDLVLNLLLHNIAESVWIERVQFPAALAIVLDKPLIAPVLLLIGGRKGQQARRVLPLQRDAPQFDVMPVVLLEAIWEIAFRHVHAGR